MNSLTLATFLKARGLTPSKAAKLLHLSRQTLSNWTDHEKNVQIRSDHLEKLSALLKTPMETLMKPLPAISGQEGCELEITLNWDKLYSSVEDLLLAALKWERPAVARLVQTYGLITTARIFGDKKTLWDRYPYYKKYIHPGVRKMLDQVWQEEWKEE